MNRKQAYSEQPAWDDTRGPETAPVVVKIPRIRCVDPANDLYEIQGLTHRHVDWHAVFAAMGYPDYPGDQLADDLGAVVWKHDLVRALAERIEPA